MARSTARFHRLEANPNSGLSDIEFAIDLAMAGNDINGVGTLNVATINGPIATTVAKGLLSATDKTRLDALHATAITTDDISGDAFGYVTRTVTGSLVVLNKTFLEENQTITLTGDVSGSGSTSIEVTLEVGAITDLPTATGSDTNDRFLVASYLGSGTYALKQISPDTFASATGTVSAFATDRGIGRKAGESGETVTLELLPLAIDQQAVITGADVASSDEFLLRDASTNTLKKVTYSDLGTAIVDDYGGGGGGGGGDNVIGAIVAMEINANGELLLLHTGAFDEDNVFINSASELILEA